MTRASRHASKIGSLKRGSHALRTASGRARARRARTSARLEASTTSARARPGSPEAADGRRRAHGVDVGQDDAVDERAAQRDDRGGGPDAAGADDEELHGLQHARRPARGAVRRRARTCAPRRAARGARAARPRWSRWSRTTAARSVERLVRRDLDEREGVGRPLSRRTRQTQRSVESYLKAGVRPRWMERLGEIDSGIAAARRRAARDHGALRDALGHDRAAFAARWRERAHAYRFDELNALIAEHNEWYPVERDLPMDPRTRDYVPVRGRSYRRPVLGPEWVLAHFPSELPDGS